MPKFRKRKKAPTQYACEAAPAAPAAAAAREPPPVEQPRDTRKRNVFEDLEVERRDTSRVPPQTLPSTCPTAWSGLVGNYRSVRSLKEFASSPENNVCIVWGPTGVGKTSAARLSCYKKVFAFPISRIGEPYLKRLKAFVKRSVRYFPHEVVLIDPLEEVVRSSGCVKALCKIIKESHGSGLGWIIVLNDLYHKFMFPLRTDLRKYAGKVTTLRFWPLGERDIKQLLVTHGVKTRDRLSLGVSVCDGNGSRAYFFARNASHEADVTLSRFRACDAMLLGQKERVRCVDNTRSYLNYISLNAPHMCGQNMDAAVVMADIASAGDVLETGMRRQDFHLEMLMAGSRSCGCTPIPKGKAIHSSFRMDSSYRHDVRMLRAFECPATELHEKLHTLGSAIEKDPPHRKRSRMRKLDEIFVRFDISASTAKMIREGKRFDLVEEEEKTR